VINTATNAVVTTIPVGSSPFGVAVTPDGAFVYVANFNSSNVSVIGTATNTEVTRIAVGNNPAGIVLTPDGAFAYVVNNQSQNVSVINTATNTEIDVDGNPGNGITRIPVGAGAIGVAVTPDGAFVYVANSSSDNVSVINTATNTVTDTVPVGDNPTAFGQFIAGLVDNDSTPPQVSCGASDGIWHNSNVSIACTASDPESGLANPADASFNLITSVSAGTEIANAATNSRQICNTVGGCTTAGPITGNKVDRKPPTITITSPAANATYQLNASVGANYTCVDAGSGVASCQGTVANASPINTSSTGTKTFTVNTSDNVGNKSSTSVTYSVVSGGGGGATSADLGITMAVAPNVSPGETLTYSITITNGSKTTATGVVVSDALPAGTVFASAATSQGTIATPPVGSNGTVTINLGSLANSVNATVSIVVTVNASAAGSTLTNTATVTATTQDLNTKNNSATQKTQVAKK
jgi:uncharacterized repeat protein (TIGR01451 family)